MIKPCTFFRLILPIALFVIPNLLRANGEPTGNPISGRPDSPDSNALKLGHCDPITLATVNCATRTIELSANIQYLFTGQIVPFVATWSTGETAQKITVVPPGAWSWDPIPTGCNEPAHYDNEYNQPGTFFTGNINITSTGAICAGSVAVLTVETDGYNFPSYTWIPDNPGGTLTPYEVFGPGTYSLELKDELNCPFMEQIDISLSPPISPTASGPPAMCPEGDTSTLQVNQAWNSYIWSNGETTQIIQITKPGLYEFTVTNQFGCTGVGIVGVQSGAVQFVPIFASSPTLYPGQEDTLRVSDIFSHYSWSNGHQGVTNIITTVGTYTVTVTNSLGCTGTGSITIGPYIPPPWIVIPTSRNQTIIIPDSLKFDAPGGSLNIGDQIGVFYDSAATGVLICGGFAVWSGLTLAFPAYGNDVAAPAQNGFITGEVFKVKFWRAGSNQIFDATAQYAPLGSLGGLITQTNTFADDGVSMITALTEGLTHAIPLNNGWNMISSYINPGHPDMLEVFDPIASSVDIIKDGDGNSCIPIIPINVIGNWNLLKGYQVRANQKDTLIVLGHKAVPEANPIPLQTGWQIIGYLRESPQNTDTVFSSIKAQIGLVKNNNGKIYSPQFGINQIGDMLPGQGYKVNALSNVMLMYRPNFTGNPMAERSKNTTESEILHFVLDSNLNTGNNATIILTDSIAKSVLALGDEIGVFTPADVLCGAAIYKQENLAITVWGDEPSTSGIVEGMNNAEAYKFKVWDTSEQKECTATTTFLSGMNAYTPDAIEVIQTLMLGVPTYASITAVACNSYVLNNQTYSSSGIYTQNLTNAAGCDSTLTLDLTINPVPIVTVNNPTICLGQPATLTASGATTYLWSNGETTNSITVSPDASTTYTVTGTTAGCSTSSLASVTLDQPTIDLGANIVLSAGDSVILDATCTCQTYQWSTGETTSTIVVYALGTYTVTVSNEAGCTVTDNIVIMTTSTSDPNDRYSISVSPNPTNNLLSVRCHGASTSEVQVFDNLGKVVFKDNGFVPDGVSRTISLKTLPAGSYFLRIVGDGFAKSVPVIKN